MAIRIGSLLVNLGLEDAGFIAGLKRAEQKQKSAFKQMSDSTKFLETSLKSMAAVAGSVFSAQVIKSALDYAGSIGEISSALGVSTRELQVYRFAATQANLSNEEIEKALGKATLELGRNNAAYAKLGISTKTAAGEIKTAGAILPELAEALQKIESPAERSAALVEIFGRTGQRLGPLLEGGAAGLKTFADEAERTGQVLSSEQIQNADKAADALAKFQNQLRVGVAGVVSENAASIERLSKAMGELLPNLSKGIQATLRFGGDVDLAVARFALNNDGNADSRARARAKIDRYTASRAAEATAFLNFPIPGANAASPSAGAADPVASVSAGMGRVRAQAKAARKELSDAMKRMEQSAGGPGVLAGAGPLDEMANRLREIQQLAIEIPPIEPINLEAVQLADDFQRNLVEGLGQAIVYGRDVGDALLASINAAAAQLVTSGLLKLLNGGGEGGSGLFGSIASGLGSLFGGARANGGPVSAGRAYLVGEKGPEILFPGMSGTIASNKQSFGGRQAVDVNVTASPELVVTAVTAGQRGGQMAAEGVVRRATRGRLMGSMGA
jgi:hypothetical protein